MDRQTEIYGMSTEALYRQLDAAEDHDDDEYIMLIETELNQRALEKSDPSTR